MTEPIQRVVVNDHDVMPPEASTTNGSPASVTQQSPQAERIQELVAWLENETGEIPEDVQREVDALYCQP